MAGRPMGKLHQDDVRRKIQATALITVLQDFALYGSGELSPARIKSIEVLLRKSIPDLAAIQIDSNQEDSTSVADVVRSFYERRGSNPDVQG